LGKEAGLWDWKKKAGRNVFERTKTLSKFDWQYNLIYLSKSLIE